MMMISRLRFTVDMAEKVTSNFYRNTTLDKELKVLCSKCKHPTTHKVYGSYSHSWSVEDGPSGYDGSELYEIIQCLGCNTVSFREERYFSEDTDYDENGNLEGGVTELLFPERDSATDNLTAITFRFLPSSIDNIYNETVSAYNSKLFILAAGGLRALVDGICVHLNIKGGMVPKTNKLNDGELVFRENLVGKIAGLIESGHLTRNQASVLHHHRLLGNEALHELAQIPADELKVGIEIAEHILRTLFELPAASQAMKMLSEQRKKK